jgi:hypothetical protein
VVDVYILSRYHKYEFIQLNTLSSFASSFILFLHTHYIHSFIHSFLHFHTIMRTAGLVVALGALLNVAFADVTCNTEALHSKPRILSADDKQAFTDSIEEVCNTSVSDDFADSRSGSTYFTLSRTQEALDEDECKTQFEAIIAKCVASQNFGGGSLELDGHTLEVSTDTPAYGLEARAPKKSKAKKTKTKAPKVKKPAKKPTKKPNHTKPAKNPKGKKPAKKPAAPKACPLKKPGAHTPTKPKKGVRGLIDSILRRAGRGGSSTGAGDQGCDDNLTETNAYLSAKQSIGNLKVGEWYKFTSKSPYTKPGPHETADEVKQLQQRLGFNHIAVVVGQVVEKVTKGKGKNKNKTETHRDFVAIIIDLIKEEDNGSKMNFANFKPTKVFKLEDGEQTSAKKADPTAVKKKAAEYFKEAGHSQYSVASNNCNTFARALMKQI